MSRRALPNPLPLLLAGLLAAPLAGLLAAPLAAREPLAERIDASLRRGGLRGARVSILVADLATGEVLYDREPDQRLVPASVTKVVTSAAALARLKPQYRFRTALYGTGGLAGGTWKGDLYLKAWGDPSLVEERVWVLAEALRQRGVRVVAGDVKVDDSYFDRERFGTDWGPLSRSWYNAPHGAVSVNFNTLKVRGRHLAIDEDPSRHAGRFLVDMLGRVGVEVKGGVDPTGSLPEGARLLVESESPPLAEVVADLNKVSNNFIAEQILKTLGAEAAGAPGTAEKGLQAVAAYLRSLGVRDEEFELFDGSGLSHSNRLTARAVVKVLQAMARDFEAGPEFLASLKVSGVEGKTRRFVDPLCRRRMRVKTGHLYGVAALAGYGETVGGRRLVFAILANDYRRGRWAADRGIEDVCEEFLNLEGPEGAVPPRELIAAPLPGTEPAVVGPDGPAGEEEELDEGD